MIPVVKFDLREFNRDFAARVKRSRRAKDAVINDMALRCARAAYAACPVGDRAKIQSLLIDHEPKLLSPGLTKKGKPKKPRWIKGYGGKARNIIVGTYFKKHGSLKGLDLSHGGEAEKKAKALVGRRISHLRFLQSRFVKPLTEMAKAVGKTGKNSKFKDEYSYGKPAKSIGSWFTTRAVLFAAYRYKTEKGAKTQMVTPAGQAKMDTAMHSGMMAMQNDWRRYAHEKLQKALNKQS